MVNQVLSVLEFLSTKLSTFMSEEGKLLGGLRHEVQLITDEFCHMKAFLQVVDSDKEDDPQLAEWTRQVREAAYDSEDVLEEFLLLFSRQRSRGFFGYIRSNFNSFKNLPARHRLATKLQEIKARVKHISEARQRYESQYSKSPAQVSGLLPANSAWRYSKDDDALYAKEDELVGIDKPKQHLLSQILDRDSKQKAIAVLGMGGIGKTTLVKRVHSDVDVENNFRIRAWVTVSQTYELKELLKVLIGRLHNGFKQSAPSSVDSMDIDELKAHIREFLGQARYVIVFDDVWHIDFWDTFRFVLIENSYGGNRVIITTRIADVAFSCIGFNGFVFRKEFLTPEESLTLFCRKTFNDNCCPAHLKDAVKGIVEKCEGLPLALVAISGVLIGKDLSRKDQWERIQRKLRHGSEGTGKLDTAKKILSMSYNDLSPNLKTCLLCTSIFAEDHEIRYRYLIGMWVAERFVAGEAGQHVEEVARHYIKELANRNLIQFDEIYDGLPEKIHIHDLLREVLVSESKKINFATIVSTTQHTTINWPPTEKVVRRLVVHGSHSFNNFVAQQSHQYFNRLRFIKTFDFTEPPSKALLSQLLSSKFLKVVDFGAMQLEEIPKEIFNLFHLTRLNLWRSKVKRVPKTIKRLKNLEYLNLIETLVRELPVEILKLPKLHSLLVYQKVDSSDRDLGIYGFKAPRNMGSLLALESLLCVDAAESDKTRIITEIGKLTQLRLLDITNLRREGGEELCSSLENLVNLQELRVASSSSVGKDKEVIILDLNHHISVSSLQSLCLLALRGFLEKMPPWISDLHNLGLITLIGSSLRDDPLESLKHLPNLIDVHLNQAYEGECLYFKSGGFQKLKKLRLKNMKGLRGMRVEEGAMPHIKYLILVELPLVEEVPSGVEHLKELQELWLWDMSSELTRKLKEGSGDYNYKRIEHIPNVYIDGRRLDRGAAISET